MRSTLKNGRKKMDKFTEGEGFFLYYSPEFNCFAEFKEYQGEVTDGFAYHKIYWLTTRKKTELHFIDEVWL